MAGLGEPDVRAELRVGVAALDARSRAPRDCCARAAGVAEPALRVGEHEQRERTQVRRTVGASERGLGGGASVAGLADRDAARCRG